MSALPPDALRRASQAARSSCRSRYAPEKETNKESHAEQIPEVLFAWLEEGFDLVGGDSTNANTDMKYGVMQKLEPHLGRELVWVVCQLHSHLLRNSSQLQKLLTMDLTTRRTSERSLQDGTSWKRKTGEEEKRGERSSGVETTERGAVPGISSLSSGGRRGAVSPWRTSRPRPRRCPAPGAAAGLPRAAPLPAETRWPGPLDGARGAEDTVGSPSEARVRTRSAGPDPVPGPGPPGT
ncbi:unnamed protein product [Merluccius merluccius]